MSDTPTKTLAEFVANQKAQYLAAVEAGNGKDWVVAMGNEAGGMRLLLYTVNQFLQPPMYGT